MVANDGRTRVVLDMETRDPDDALTLCLAATHPALALCAVTVNPGTREQVGVVRALLDRLSIAVPVGARTPGRVSGAVAPFHHHWLGEVAPAEPEGVAHELLAEVLASAPDVVLLTAAPLHNLRLLLRHHPGVDVPRWVTQGGFAGANIVPPEHSLAKFAGLMTCESYNFGHDVKGTLAALSSERVHDRWLVSKNVTHGVPWDDGVQDLVDGLEDAAPGVALAGDAMRLYLEAHPEGKLLHDPLALAAVVDREAFSWESVEVYREQGRWGARPRTDSRTSITVAVDAARALSAILLPVRRGE